MPAFFNILIKKAGNLYQNFVLFIEHPWGRNKKLPVFLIIFIKNTGKF